ncbi:MAG: dihydrodipicolinate synthase family protein [Thermoproteota archaeon]
MPSSAKSFGGTYVATVTPFRKNREIDMDSFEWLVSKLAVSGVTGIFIGTTGEWVTLSLEERAALVSKAKSAAPSLKVIVVASSHDPSRYAEYGRRLLEAGADAVAYTPPSYYRVSAKRLRSFLEDVLERVEGDVLLYTIPSHVGYNIEVDDVVYLVSNFSNLKGIKATVDDVHYLHQLASREETRNADFAILSGYGEYALYALSVGGDGAVDALANMVPSLLARLYAKWVAGSFVEAVRLHRAYALLSTWAAGQPLPALIKAVLKIMGAPLEAFSRAYAWAEGLLREAAEAIATLICKDAVLREHTLQGLSCGGGQSLA